MPFHWRASRQYTSHSQMCLPWDPAFFIYELILEMHVSMHWSRVSIVIAKPGNNVSVL